MNALTSELDIFALLLSMFLYLSIVYCLSVLHYHGTKLMSIMGIDDLVIIKR